ncbi:MAG: 16S rRNA (cytidine(1402)-2'-O)-methyltransferase [Bacilli bacterium]
MAKGTLFLVPSPIGNLDDISKRVLNTLSSVDYVACEDTRNTAKLLSILGIKKTCISCHEHNESSISPKIINDINNGQSVAYLSDAGYPCISDPGYLLVLEAIKNNIKVTPISGASAFLNSLVGSGIDPKHFIFYGFLNSKGSDRRKELEDLKSLPFTIIFYEAPHRINDTLKDIYTIFGNRKITICRELTKIHEEFIRSDLETLVKENKEFIGELVLVIDKPKEAVKEYDFDDIKSKIELLISSGITKKDAISSVSLLFKIPKNIIKKIYY